MSDRPDPTLPWDVYWSGREQGADDAPHLGVLREFWSQRLLQELTQRQSVSLLDICCGDGALTRLAIELAAQSGTELNVCCLDGSAAAIGALRADCPAVEGVVADARQTGLATGRFDVVVSQFGLEYPGVDAFAEAARLTGGQGVLICIVHLADGALDKECKNHLQASRAFLATGFLDRAQRVFGAGFGALQGSRTVEAFEREQRRFAPVVAAARTIGNAYGEHVAGGLIARVLTGVEQMHRRMQHYDSGEVAEWLRRAHQELGAYIGRMEAMREAAVDEAGIARIVPALENAGLTIDLSDTLCVGADEEPFARTLVCRR